MESTPQIQLHAVLVLLTGTTIQRGKLPRSDCASAQKFVDSISKTYFNGYTSKEDTFL